MKIAKENQTFETKAISRDETKAMAESVHHRDNEDLATLTLEDFTAKITTEIKERSL